MIIPNLNCSSFFSTSDLSSLIISTRRWFIHILLRYLNPHTPIPSWSFPSSNSLPLSLYPSPPIWPFSFCLDLPKKPWFVKWSSIRMHFLYIRLSSSFSSVVFFIFFSFLFFYLLHSLIVVVIIIIIEHDLFRFDHSSTLHLFFFSSYLLSPSFDRLLPPHPPPPFARSLCLLTIIVWLIHTL